MSAPTKLWDHANCPNCKGTKIVTGGDPLYGMAIAFPCILTKDGAEKLRLAELSESPQDRWRKWQAKAAKRYIINEQGTPS